ncbi:hypothetical protein KC19_VG286100, partial [Ceratodon purpureus]
FPIVRFRAHYGNNHNPYIFPLNVSQVFFMPDAADREWRVIIRHDPRAKRIVVDEVNGDFGAAELSDLPSREATSVDASTMTQASEQEEPEVESVPLPNVQVLDAQTHEEEDDDHYDDDQHVDEFIVEWVE